MASRVVRLESDLKHQYLRICQHIQQNPQLQDPCILMVAVRKPSGLLKFAFYLSRRGICIGIRSRGSTESIHTISAKLHKNPISWHQRNVIHKAIQNSVPEFETICQVLEVLVNACAEKNNLTQKSIVADSITPHVECLPNPVSKSVVEFRNKFLSQIAQKPPVQTPANVQLPQITSIQNQQIAQNTVQNTAQNTAHVGMQQAQGENLQVVRIMEKLYEIANLFLQNQQCVGEIWSKPKNPFMCFAISKGGHFAEFCWENGQAIAKHIYIAKYPFSIPDSIYRILRAIFDVHLTNADCANQLLWSRIVSSFKNIYSRFEKHAVQFKNSNWVFEKMQKNLRFYLRDELFAMNPFDKHLCQIVQSKLIVGEFVDTFAVRHSTEGYEIFWITNNEYSDHVLLKNVDNPRNVIEGKTFGGNFINAHNSDMLNILAQKLYIQLHGEDAEPLQSIA